MAWVRGRDGHILTVGRETFVADPRISSVYSAAGTCGHSGHGHCGNTEGTPFMKCIVSIWALPVRGGVKACQDGLGALFSHVCPFDRGGGV